MSRVGILWVHKGVMTGMVLCPNKSFTLVDTERNESWCHPHYNPYIDYPSSHKNWRPLLLPYNAALYDLALLRPATHGLHDGL